MIRTAMGLSGWRFCAILGGVLVAVTAAHEAFAAEPIQSQSDFEIAIRDNSTSPFIVLITAVDDRTGQSRTGCTGANLLLGAITIEQFGGFSKIASENGPRLQQARQVALQNTSHVFHFANQAALDNIPFRYSTVCDAIRRGLSARDLDFGGPVVLPVCWISRVVTEGESVRVLFSAAGNVEGTLQAQGRFSVGRSGISWLSGANAGATEPGLLLKIDESVALQEADSHHTCTVTYAAQDGRVGVTAHSNVKAASAPPADRTAFIPGE